MSRMKIVLVALLALAPSCAPPAASSWTADVGIYGTYNHFGNPPSGPPTYLCGVAYDLRFRGSEVLQSVDVAVRYPDAFIAHLTAPAGLTAGQWQRRTLPVEGSGSLTDAARLGHASGAVGGVCRNGPANLEALRGAIVRVIWRSASGEHEQRFAVDDVRGEVAFYAGQLSPDGQVRIEWKTRP